MSLVLFFLSAAGAAMMLGALDMPFLRDVVFIFGLALYVLVVVAWRVRR